MPPNHTQIAKVRLILLWTRGLCRRDPMEVLRLAIEGGVGAVQVREKQATARELYEAAREAKEATDVAGAHLHVNDRIDVAIAIGADGVQIGQDDLPLADARRLAPENFSIGVSTHSPEQARAAAAGGAGFVGFGPMFATPTKPGERPIGPSDLARVTRELAIPVFAIGGLDAARIATIGAARAAVSSAILGAVDPLSAARAIREALDANAKNRGTQE